MGIMSRKRAVHGSGPGAHGESALASVQERAHGMWAGHGAPPHAERVTAPPPFWIEPPLFQRVLYSFRVLTVAGFSWYCLN